MGAHGHISGLATMPVSAIFSRIIYSRTFSPSWFAYSWVVVFVSILVSIGAFVPIAAIFFSTIKWCCGHDRKILPGQANYAYDDFEMNGCHGEKGDRASSM